MDSGQPQQPILETLRTVEFRLGLKGYNVDEVDEYLEKAAVEAERLTEQLRQTTERLRQATERLGQLESGGAVPAPAAAVEPVPVAAAPAAPPAPAPVASAAPAVADDALQQTLLLAQRFVEQTKRESEAEANRLVSSAEERARSLMARAEDEARQLMTDSQQRLRDEVARLETMRAQLATDVENMARHLESERTRLRTMLSEVLKWIEENVQPAESLMALRPRAVDGARSAAGRLGTGDARPAARRPEPFDGEETGDDDPDDTVAQVLDLRGSSAAPPEGRG